MKLILLITISILSSSCCEVRHKPVDLSGKILPSLDDLISKEEVKDISIELRDKIILIDKRRKTYRGVIESTQSQD